MGGDAETALGRAAQGASISSLVDATLGCLSRATRRWVLYRQRCVMPLFSKSYLHTWHDRPIPGNLNQPQSTYPGSQERYVEDSLAQCLANSTVEFFRTAFPLSQHRFNKQFAEASKYWNIHRCGCCWYCCCTGFGALTH